MKMSIVVTMVYVFLGSFGLTNPRVRCVSIHPIHFSCLLARTYTARMICSHVKSTHVHLVTRDSHVAMDNVSKISIIVTVDCIFDSSRRSAREEISHLNVGHRWCV